MTNILEEALYTRVQGIPIINGVRNTGCVIVAIEQKT